jgi:hypothetical protein
MIKKGGKPGFCVSLIFLIIFILLASSALYAYKAIQLNQPKVRLIIPPGQTKAGRIEVKNASNEPQAVKIYVEDWVYADDTGSKKFMPPATSDLSCANWISFAPAEFAVPAFGKQYVNYTVRVPKDAIGGHYAVLFFESRLGKSEVKPEEKTETMVSMPVAIRIGSLFYIEPEGTINRSAQLGKLSLERKSNSEPLAINLDFKNTGNVDIIAAGNFNIIDKQGIVYSRGEFSNKIYTFAGNTAKFTATTKEPLPKGKYDFIITLDLGQALEELSMGRGPILVKEAEIEIGNKGEVVSIGELR